MPAAAVVEATPQPAPAESGAAAAQGEAVHWFDLRTVPATPWKNGGGSTRELVCWPPGAGTDAFGWRMSVARIAAAGPFSAFAGVDRQIMLLDGDGVTLHGEQAELCHTLQQRWQPWSFAGEQPLNSRLIGGPSTDFNLMLRRGQWQGHMQMLHDTGTVGATGAGLCMVLQGQWAVLGGDAARVLQPGQGLWWPEAMGARVLQPLQPLSPEAANPHPFAPDVRPALVWVDVVPVHL
ncbi:hypothetical protein CLU88_0503 [Acidovorax sp. 56]|nr:hypothetical protein CLU88_0503 [Acidovorax sp. 56]